MALCLSGLRAARTPTYVSYVYRLTWGNNFSTIWFMGKLHAQQNWLIRVQGNEHPPVHVHVLHPDGRALIDLGGNVLNAGVPDAVIAAAAQWVAANAAAICAEWARMNNPPAR
ncbi:MAG: DUF4160 domain-containing protein [Proteobacteria bacterium]|nr:DUF4160 domain-containing protein [Pseudomonadota bacterium]